MVVCGGLCIAGAAATAGGIGITLYDAFKVSRKMQKNAAKENEIAEMQAALEKEKAELEEQKNQQMKMMMIAGGGLLMLIMLLK